MLQSLYLNNFAIIDDLTISFENHFTVITGETGAGKSIIAGSLMFLSGAKSDLSILKNKEKKAVAEAVFNIGSNNLDDFFISNEFEKTSEIIIRREILPSGTTRCYINDNVVNIGALKEIIPLLIDIHSQHQNLLLTHRDFQLYVLDAIAKQLNNVGTFRKNYQNYLQKNTELQKLLEIQKQQQQQIDYLSFQLNELKALKYTEEEFKEIENECNTLEHAEEILLHLKEIVFLTDEQENATLTQLKNTQKILQAVQNKFSKAEEWSKRFESLYLELKDLAQEIDSEQQKVQANPSRLEYLQTEISNVYNLLQKHRLSEYKELIGLRQDLNEKFQHFSGMDDQIETLTNEIQKIKLALENSANLLHKKRQNASEELVKKIIPFLQRLGIFYASFEVNLQNTDDFNENGKSQVIFLFSANTKISPQPIDKIASGGELSRLMLTLKAIISGNNTTETIFFDEIDTGISGEIAYQMGMIMEDLANEMQVISITHLPQVAACGKHHKLVVKNQDKQGTQVEVKDLFSEHRINEIAKMMSAKEVTESALAQAEHLLNDRKSL